MIGDEAVFVSIGHRIALEQTAHVSPVWRQSTYYEVANGTFTGDDRSLLPYPSPRMFVQLYALVFSCSLMYVPGRSCVAPVARVARVCMRWHLLASAVVRSTGGVLSAVHSTRFTCSPKSCGYPT